MKLRVRNVRSVADAVLEVELESMGGLDLPTWSAGAHLELKLPSGLVRHYSLCGDLEDRATYRIAVLREEAGRGGSSELHAVAAPGAVFEVRPPRNNFGLEVATSYLFLAGGIGITPLIPMMQRATEDGIPWRLVYGGRSRSHIAFADELMDSGGPNIAVFTDDREGRPDFAAEIGALPEGGLIFACGPGPMLDAVGATADRMGLADQLRLERFAVAAVDTGGEPFEVELARTGVTLAIGDDETILTAMRARGLPAPFSCENGYCGTCEAVVLDGEADHRDTYLTDEEKTEGFTMMICVSRCAASPLVLDL